MKLKQKTHQELQAIMNYQRSLFTITISFISFINIDLLALAQSHCQYNANYTSNGKFRANLITTLNSCSTNVDNNGFYNVSVGQGVDRVNGVVLCRGDAQLNACRDCIRANSAELLKSCPNQKQAVRWEEFCMLRYSNEALYRAMASRPSDHWPSPQQNATSPVLFQRSLATLLDDLRNRAASGGSLRKVAAGNITGPDAQTIFALAQCTPDLSRDDCSRCLVGAAKEIPEYCDRKTGCRVLWPSCNLRFEIYQFFNETRLQEFKPNPAPVPVPVPAPAPPPHTRPHTYTCTCGNSTFTVTIG